MIKYSTTFLCQFQLNTPNILRFSKIAHLVKIKTIFCWHSVKPNKMELLNSKTKSNQAQPNSTQYIVYRNLDNYQLFQNFQYFLVTWKGKDATSKISEVHWGAQLPQHKKRTLPRKFTNFFPCTYFWTKKSI